MYIPAAFKVSDEDTLFDLIERYSFGLLLNADSPPMVSHLPYLLDRSKRSLFTHLARVNPQAATLAAGATATAVFQGPHAYVSPGWYANQDAVPTWNYVAVHVTGTVTPINDNAVLAARVGDLTTRHESAVASDWDQTRATVGALIGHIAGFDIAIERMEGNFKLSQNRSQADQRGVIRQLSQSADGSEVALADLMAKQLES